MNTNSSNPEGANRSLDLLSGILSNPEALGRIASVLNTVMSAPPSESLRTDGLEREKTGVSLDSAPVSVEPTSDQPPRGAESPNQGIRDGTSGGISGSVTDGLGGLLSNPAMLEQLPQILAVMKPLMTAMPTPKPPLGTPRKREDCRNDLLLALKPFLSAERCNAIDSIIRISHLGNVFSQLK